MKGKSKSSHDLLKDDPHLSSVPAVKRLVCDFQFLKQFPFTLSCLLHEEVSPLFILNLDATGGISSILTLIVEGTMSRQTLLSLSTTVLS